MFDCTLLRTGYAGSSVLSSIKILKANENAERISQFAGNKRAWGSALKTFGCLTILMEAAVFRKSRLFKQLFFR